MSKMTLKEKKFETELKKPENGLNQAKCMRKAGYTEATTRAGKTYNQLRKHTQSLDFLNPKRINSDTDENRKEARKDKSHSVVESIDARRAKMAGMIVDKGEYSHKIEHTKEEEAEYERLRSGVTNRVGLVPKDS